MGPGSHRPAGPHAQNVVSWLHDTWHYMTTHLQVLRHAFPHEARSYGLQRALHIAVVAVHDDEINVACGQVQTCSQQGAGCSGSRDPQHAALPPVEAPKHRSLALLKTAAPKDLLSQPTASAKAVLVQICGKLVDLAHASTEELGQQRLPPRPAHL